MPHRLAEPGRTYKAPLTVALRYRCECGDRELLTIQAVCDISEPEDLFIRRMRDLRADMLFEITQHIREQA